MNAGPTPFLAILALAVAGCGDGGLSTAEARKAAEERIRQSFQLPPDAELSSEIVVGRPRDGDIVLCGITTDPGGRVPPQRFIAATDPARWLQIAPLDSASPNTATDKFVEWEEHCSGAIGDGGEELGSPPASGEEG